MIRMLHYISTFINRISPLPYPKLLKHDEYWLISCLLFGEKKLINRVLLSSTFFPMLLGVCTFVSAFPRLFSLHITVFLHPNHSKIMAAGTTKCGMRTTKTVILSPYLTIETNRIIFWKIHIDRNGASGGFLSLSFLLFRFT